MEPKLPSHLFRSALGGFDKKDVTDYITKLHMAHRREMEKMREQLTTLQQEHLRLADENALLKRGGAVAAPAGDTKVIEVPVERVVQVPVERIVEKIVEVPVEKIVHVPVERVVEKVVEVPQLQPIALEPDLESLNQIKDLEFEVRRLGSQIDAHIDLREQLERRLHSQSSEAIVAKQEADALRGQVSELSKALLLLEQKMSDGNDAETLAYHRAEAIEREARFNAAQIRLALEELLRDAQEVLRGVKAQTLQETAQIAVRANHFLEMLNSTPEMLDIVARQVDAVRPEGVATPLELEDTLE